MILSLQTLAAGAALATVLGAACQGKQPPTLGPTTRQAINNEGTMKEGARYVRGKGFLSFLVSKFLGFKVPKIYQNVHFMLSGRY